MRDMVSISITRDLRDKLSRWASRFKYQRKSDIIEFLFDRFGVEMEKAIDDWEIRQNR